MSEKSQVGVLGQQYEDRLTGKRGVLIDRNEEHCSLIFESAEGTKFTVSNVTFKSKWRKCAATEEIVIPKSLQSEEDETEVVEEKPEKKEKKPKEKKPKEKKQPVANETAKPVEFKNQRIEDVLDSFISSVKQNHDDAVVNHDYNFLNVSVDGVLVMKCTLDKDTIKYKMLPDIFSYSVFKNIGQNTEFRLSKNDDGSADHLTVRFSTPVITFGDILCFVKDAITDINLYGYIEE